MNASGSMNWLGLWTLYAREVRRFMKVGVQTVLAPMVTTLLFMAVFALALGGNRPDIAGVPYLDFLAPGLVMMAIVQNAFANTSSSIIISKVQGNIIDVLMPPLSAHELTLAFALGGITRGLVVGVAVAAGLVFFVPMGMAAPLYVLFHAVAASMMLSLLGIVAGIWADKFDHMAAVTNFIVTPLSFLSGTFYSILRLPDAVQVAAHFNPFFYMIDGFRYGFTGHADGVLWLGLVVMTGSNLLLWLVCWCMFASGYKLKA